MVETPRLQAKQVFNCRSATFHTVCFNRSFCGLIAESTNYIWILRSSRRPYAWWQTVDFNQPIL